MDPEAVLTDDQKVIRFRKTILKRRQDAGDDVEDDVDDAAADDVGEDDEQVASNDRLSPAFDLSNPASKLNDPQAVVDGVADGLSDPLDERVALLVGRCGLGLGLGGRGVVAHGPTDASLDDDRGAAPALRHVLALDALLQEHDALEERLGPRRAARHVDVDRKDLVDALGHGVAVPVGTAAVGARAHGDHVLGVGHLLVEPQDGGSHLVGHGARDHDQVGLTGAGRQRDDAQTHDVVAGRRKGGAHLDRAARKAPLVHPDGVLAGQVEELGERLRHLAALDQT